jgi:RNA polymerase sigma factor (sigma-70 family)
MEYSRFQEWLLKNPKAKITDVDGAGFLGELRRRYDGDLAKAKMDFGIISKYKRKILRFSEGLDEWKYNKNEDDFIRSIYQDVLTIADRIRKYYEKFGLKSASTEDLAQEGLIGALETQPPRGKGYDSYLKLSVVGSILSSAFQGNLIRIKNPALQFRVMRNLGNLDELLEFDDETAKSILTNTFGVKSPDYVSFEEFRKIKYGRERRRKELGNILDSIRINNSSNILFLEDSENPTPLDEYEKMELRKVLADSLKHLNPKQEKALTELFGVNIDNDLSELPEYDCEKTLEEIAKVYGVSRERIRQVKTKALSHLKKHRKDLKSYLERE